MCNCFIRENWIAIKVDSSVDYGTTKNINNSTSDVEKKLLQGKSKFILMPDDNLKKFWNILMIFLLFYVATLVPYNICFDVSSEEGYEWIETVDLIVDALFFIDIIINFLSSYEDAETGLPIISFKKIAGNYLKGWFILDFLAVLPVQLIEEYLDGGNQLKLARLARLPRLYRLVRILRMIKMLRVFRKSSQFKEWMNTLNVSVGLIRMANMLSLMFFMVHLMACFWYMAATLEDNLFATWVGERGIVDSPKSYQYFNSFYWAFQTVTTVGYGDFTVQTTTEYILALIWMIIGVNFYSFTIGNVSSIIASMDQKSAILNSKLNTL